MNLHYIVTIKKDESIKLPGGYKKEILFLWLNERTAAGQWAEFVLVYFYQWIITKYHVLTGYSPVIIHVSKNHFAEIQQSSAAHGLQKNQRKGWRSQQQRNRKYCQKALLYLQTRRKSVWR